MRKNERNTKRTPRIVAQTLAVSILMGTVVPTGGLGRGVYASEGNVSQQGVEVVEAAAIGIESTEKEDNVQLDEEQKELLEAAKKEAEAGKQAVITVGQGIISDEALGIIHEVQAKQELDEAKNALADGEQRVEEALEGFDTQIDNSKTAAFDAKEAANVATDEAFKAESALEAAKNAETSDAAKEQEIIAKEAADAAQNAADTAVSEAQEAKDAYVEAEKAYQEALKEAAEAEKVASEAMNAAEQDAQLAAKKAAEAEAKVQELKGEVETAREKAEEHFTEKEAALSQAQQDLAAAKENLTEAAAKEETAREELRTATEAVVETGAFLVAAEAYETLAEVTVEGLKFAIFAMEEAKAGADQALADAEAALKFAEGNDAETQAAYDAALAAYHAANATLEQANADLEAAKAQQDAADTLANSDYGQRLTAIEKELIEANNTGDTALVEQKTQELIATVIKYDQSSNEAKYESVELIDSTKNIYEAKDIEGNTVYYQYVKNTDGSFSFYECNKNEEATTIKSREIVTELPSFEDREDWEYDVVDLKNGSYEIIYYDVVSAENVFTSEEEAKNSIAEGEAKEIYTFEVSTEETKAAIKFTEEVPTLPNVLDSKYWSGPLYNRTFHQAEYDADMSTYQTALAAYADAKKAYNTANAERNAALQECLTQGDTLTVVVDGVETRVYSNEFGLYRMAVVGCIEIPVYDIVNYDVKIAGTETHYRVVEYNEITKIDYTMVDTTADDSYENVTQKVEAAKNQFAAASGRVESATVQKNAAQKQEQTKAAELASAEQELARIQKAHDTITELYDSYYGNEEVVFEIPEDVAKVINMLEITDTSEIVSLLDKTGIFETLGINPSEAYIEIADDGQVTIEIPGTSQYAKHMVTLELAKLAAQENLKAAQTEVAKRRIEHVAAVENLAVKTVEYGKAVKELTDAAIEVRNAELNVGMATTELTAAEVALEACKAAEAYAAELAIKAQEARVKAETARQLVETLKNDITVGRDMLAAAEAALEEAEAELLLAEQAAVDAQKEAEAAKAAYIEITKIVAELEQSETVDPDEPEVNPDEPVNPPMDPDEPEVNPSKPSGSGSSGSSGSSSDSSSVSATPAVSSSQNIVTIDEESVPLAQFFTLGELTFVDVTPELIKGELPALVMQKYYGQKLYMMAHMGNGIGYTINAEGLASDAASLQLLAYLELIENFAEGFTTMHYVPAKEVVLSYTIGIHMQVGTEYTGKPAYIFSKNRTTGLYEICQLTTVSENGNVAVQTKEISEMMIMIME